MGLWVYGFSAECLVLKFVQIREIRGQKHCETLWLNSVQLCGQKGLCRIVD